MACFADINVSQGSVATYARCGGIFSTHLTTNLPVEIFFKNRLSFDRIVVMSLWPTFWPTLGDSDVTESIRSKYCGYNLAYLSAITVTSIFQSFNYKMAAKTKMEKGDQIKEVR